ncbi:Teneurin-a [Trichoplax sp. H2]|nr:Teneurin-a [Trichoplax sp. H2]|eukprot:RDD43841.1 Teneurin-a [Trichoplax sp. H2]
MMTQQVSRLLFILCLVLIQVANLYANQAKITLTMVQYRNPNQHLYTGSKCELLSGCDYIFKIDIGTVSSKSRYFQMRSNTLEGRDILIFTSGQDLAPGIKNPILVNLQTPLPNERLQISIVVEHDEYNGKYSLVDNLKYESDVNSGTNNNGIVILGERTATAKTELTVDLKIECTEGWQDSKCDKAICSTGCSPIHGTCKNSPNTCSCNSGWTGSTCETCLKRTDCVNGNCQQGNDCVCISGWHGSLCNIANCSTECQRHGRCMEPNRCICYLGWTGNNCDTCLKRSGCSENGYCVNGDDCVCNEGWDGSNCDRDLHPCANPSQCANGGTCIRLGTSQFQCNCMAQFTGSRCEYLKVITSSTTAPIRTISNPQLTSTVTPTAEQISTGKITEIISTAYSTITSTSVRSTKIETTSSMRTTIVTNSLQSATKTTERYETAITSAFISTTLTQTSSTLTMFTSIPSTSDIFTPTLSTSAMFTSASSISTISTPAILTPTSFISTTQAVVDSTISKSPTVFTPTSSTSTQTVFISTSKNPTTFTSTTRVGTTVSTTTGGLPSQPQIIGIIEGDDHLNISWSASTSTTNDLIMYYIRYEIRTGKDEDSSCPNCRSTPKVSRLYHLLDGLPGNTPYRLKVIAENSVGDSQSQFRFARTKGNGTPGGISGGTYGAIAGVIGVCILITGITIAYIKLRKKPADDHRRIEDHLYDQVYEFTTASSQVRYG